MNQPIYCKQCSIPSVLMNRIEWSEVPLPISTGTDRTLIPYKCSIEADHYRFIGTEINEPHISSSQ